MTKKLTLDELLDISTSTSHWADDMLDNPETDLEAINIISRYQAINDELTRRLSKLILGKN